MRDSSLTSSKPVAKRLVPAAFAASCAEKAPGVLLAVVIAMASMFVNEHYGGPVMLYALLAGMAFNFLRADERFAPGITFTAKQILRIGVALLGVRITVGEAAALGLPTVLLVVAGVAFAIVFGSWIGRLMGLRSDHAVLSAGAVAICGASAALAISAVLPQHKDSERNTILTVVGVTALSTIAMVAYPIIASLLNLNDVEAGVFVGATIHDVAQVVGAGYTISDEAGETATIVKLMRVACLVPVVFCVGLIFRNQCQSLDSGRRPPLLPMFLIAFVALMVFNSVGGIPVPVQSGLSEASRWALVAAVSALGVKTSMGDIFKVGITPVAVLTLQTLVLGAFGLAALVWFLAL